MKILALTAENVKRLKAVSIAPDGAPVVTVGGRNGAGKSSVLDSIQYALGGTRDVPDRPIRDGEERAEVVVTLDGLKVTRVFTAKGSRLVVANGDGAQYPSPQAMLDKLVGRLSFDPLAFARQAKSEPKKAVETLRSLVGLDFAEIDARRKAIYEERTDANRDVNRLRVELEQATRYDDAPDEEVDVAALLDEQTAARATARANADTRAALNSLKRDNDRRHDAIVAQDAEILDLEEKLAAARERLVEMNEVLAAYLREEDEERARVESLADPDEAPINERIRSANQINARIAANRARAAIETRLRDASNRSDGLTASIDALDAEKAAALSGTSFPVPGLSFDDAGILYNGIPFAQASSGEQLRVSVSMGLALNPKLRVVLIREGSLLDADNLALIGEMAAEADAQVWIERVGDGESCSVVIEDGAVTVRATDDRERR